jgi:uncharacterized protein (TIGR02145 family)
MKKQTNTSAFDSFLKKLVQDFGGIEIFNEENESRLNKAVKTLADSFSQEKKWMQVACIESIPQKLYSVIEFPPKAQQKMIDNCLKELASLGLTSQVVEDVAAGIISILKLKGSTKKEPEIEMVLGEADIAGDTYKTCKIGNQIWMAENLRCLKLFGDEMGIAVPGNKYGRLYTHGEAQNFYYDDFFKGNVSKRKIPVRIKRDEDYEGWHLPTIEDWLKMVSYIESLGFDAGTALKSNGDWSGDADSGLDLFGFEAHPLKKWDDNFPKKEKMCPRNSIWKEENARIKAGNENIELSKVTHFPCVQFWTNTNYVDDPYIEGDMAYVATINSAKNTIDLDNGKISGPSGLDPDLPFGFACVRFVKDAD